MGKKVVLAIVVVVVVVAGAVVYWSMNIPRTNAPSAPVAGVVSDTDAEPDAIANAVLAGESQAELTPEEVDASLTASDATLVNEFDQSFNASQF
jgi:hypothetical protein